MAGFAPILPLQPRGPARASARHSARVRRGALALVVALTLAGCLPGPTFNGGQPHSGPHYQGDAPLATAAIARQQAAVERRQILRELKAIREAVEDD